MITYGTLCHNCRGAKTIPTSATDATPIPCSTCEGTGYEPRGMVDFSDIEDILNDLLDKVRDIKEQIDEM